MEAKTLVDRLNGGKEELDVVSVIGMGGLGKTTLAKKVFTDPAIEFEFYIRAWIYVSQEYDRKEVFIGILGSLDNLTDEIPALNKYRRLCIHSRVLDHISTKPSGPHVRSFLCFASESRELRREHTSFVHDAFKLLRVFDIKSISLPLFPSKIKDLVHLRYVSLSGSFEVLPASISELWNLQTIIIETSSHNLKVEADIWKMLQLRHLFTSASSRLRGPPSKARKGGKDPLVRRNLQTLSTISPESCMEDILARAPNLRKLGIRGNIATLMEDKGGSSMFDNLTKLDQLVTLKLLNDTFPLPPSRGSLPSCTNSHQI
ncbi:hypothetical protein LOK49_LG11G00401 [Camellia lanceoleosa]|uniref:Uncharacterized protein n=1 Tax=Camellia lanceoleosa TaxID=1840588 RepID=A0ACC0FXL1_9ERIC|nr:hypothetical protein LOK49_LG11G00401 [Camellia lanceoleosa]